MRDTKSTGFTGVGGIAKQNKATKNPQNLNESKRLAWSE